MKNFYRMIWDLIFQEHVGLEGNLEYLSIYIWKNISGGISDLSKIK